MPHRNIINANSEAEIWKVITEQLSSKEENVDYTAQFSIDDYCITLDVDVSPYDDEEDLEPNTSFWAPLSNEAGFRFKIEKQILKHEIGKLFGMQDIVLGDPAFDKRFLVQSNDVIKVKEIFFGADVLTALLNSPVAVFETRERKIGVNRELVLRLHLEGAITNPATLQEVFQPFKMVLEKLK